MFVCLVDIHVYLVYNSYGRTDDDGNGNNGRDFHTRPLPTLDLDSDVYMFGYIHRTLGQQNGRFSVADDYS